MRAVDLVIPVVRSISGRSGALIGGLGIAVPMLPLRYSAARQMSRAPA